MTDRIPQIGGRIRQLRRQKAMSQAKLAQDLGISASYLNLIEHNRRKLTVPLLLTLAQNFGLQIGDLTASDEQRLSGDLMELFADDLFGDIDLTNHDVKEFTNTSPAVARAIVLLYDKFRDIRENAPADTDASTQQRLASEQVSDFLQENGNSFQQLEGVADRLLGDIGHGPPGLERLCGYLINVFGISVDIRAMSESATRFDADLLVLTVSDTLPLSSRLFAISKCIGEQAAGSEIAELIGNATFSHGSVERLAKSALASYVAGAILMPYGAFLKAAQGCRYDVERLSLRFNVSFEQVCHRLTTLQKPGASGVPFHLVRTDIAGNISKRFSKSGINIPRHGGACPRWNVYEAFMQPGRITIQISQMPDNTRYFCIARTLTKGENRHDGDLKHMSIGLGCDLSQAHRLVYSDGYDLSNPTRITRVGVSCRVCPHQNCASRAFPALNDLGRIS